MAREQFGIRVDGVRELVRAVGQVDASYRKQIGQANKAIGQRVIDSSYPKPTPVGMGAGAMPRASAATTSLRIVAGTTTRKHVGQQWGSRYAARRTKRPYIRDAAEKQMAAIEREYVHVLMTAARNAGLTTKG